MAKIQFSNGETAEVDPSNPEHMAWVDAIQKSLPPPSTTPLADKTKADLATVAETGPSLAGFGGELAQSAGRGAVQSTQMPVAAVAGANPLLGSLVKPFLAKANEALDRELPRRDGLIHRFAEGAGGGLLLGGANRAAILGGGSGNMAAGASDNYLESLDLPEPIKKVVSAIVGIVTGGAVGYGLGPRPTMTPEQRVNSDTATLSDIALERLRRGQVDAPTVANQTADAANRHISRVEGRGSRDYGNTIQGQSITPRESLGIRQDLLAARTTELRTAPQELLQELADALVTTHPVTGAQTMITSVPELNAAIKTFKTTAASPNKTTGKTFSDTDVNNAVSYLEQLLGARSSAYEMANRRFGAWNRFQVDPLLESPLGTVAGRNKFSDAPTPVGRLNALVDNRRPGDIPRTLADLQSEGGNVPDIARVLIERALAKGPQNPEAALLGGPGSTQEQRVAALIQAAGRNPDEVLAPVRAAGSLSRTVPEVQSTAESVRLHKGGATGTIANLFGRGSNQAISRAQAQEQIAQLLAGASPQEVQRLMGLFVNQPNIRRLQAGAAALVPAIQQSQGGQ